MIQQFSPGDRVTTPTGKQATVLPKPWEMPIHTLIQVDAGAKVWILTDLLKPASSEGGRRVRRT